MGKKSESTFDRMMKKSSFKKEFDEGYQHFLLCEMVRALMDSDDKSVRELASELGVSKTVIQNLRSGTQTDVKLSNFLKLIAAYGYHLVLEKGEDRIQLPAGVLMQQQKSQNPRAKKVS